MAYLLHHLLQRTAALAPDKQAVVYRNSGLSYRELDRASSQVAHTLQAHGIAKGERVGIYLNRSIASVVALFGILKTGAVYVPLDPAAPVRRVAFIIGNCDIRALVTEAKKITSLAPALPTPCPIQTLILTDDHPPAGDMTLPQAGIASWSEVLRAPVDLRPPANLIEDDLAYILYTSGSTGEPKGVMISHRASLSFIHWSGECFQVNSTDRVSNHAPLHFDLSVFDIFTTIKVGAAVILVPDEFSVFPINLANFIEEQHISIWYSVPSVLTRLVLYGDLPRHRFANLRTILFAGEVLPVKYLRQLKASLPHAQYFNLYGPTETNVCTYYPIAEIPPERVDPFPIGKACANTEVFALNERQAVAAPGEVGELYVRGPSLMQGYWGMPDKTQEVLIPDPRAAAFRAGKVYRTGDLVKQDPDGNYVFLGRRDNMIKSRGYRIELGEVETAFYAHPKVEEVAVIAIPDEQIGNEIKAVVVTRDGELTTHELAFFCAQRIPKYMLPGIIEFRPALPKTSTGKVDKTVLVKDHLQG
jgi:amino acid adenylation domain-containing protein